MTSQASPFGEDRYVSGDDWVRRATPSAAVPGKLALYSGVGCAAGQGTKRLVHFGAYRKSRPYFGHLRTGQRQLALPLTIFWFLVIKALSSGILWQPNWRQRVIQIMAIAGMALIGALAVHIAMMLSPARRLVLDAEGCEFGTHLRRTCQVRWIDAPILKSERDKFGSSSAERHCRLPANSTAIPRGEWPHGDQRALES